jgi:hypothetical protein
MSQTSMSQTPTSPTSATILEHRTKAAELSGGTSGNAIYAIIERVIAERGLGGKILDYGAGVLQLTLRLLALERFDAVSASEHHGSAQRSGGKAEGIEQDLNIPVEGHDDAYVVVAGEVIEHLENPRFYDPRDFSPFTAGRYLWPILKPCCARISRAFFRRLRSRRLIFTSPIQAGFPGIRW